MLNREMALAMGTPVYPEAAAAALVDLDIVQYVSAQLGNSMHTAVICLVVGVMLSCTREVH